MERSGTSSLKRTEPGTRLWRALEQEKDWAGNLTLSRCWASFLKTWTTGLVGNLTLKRSRRRFFENQHNQTELTKLFETLHKDWVRLDKTSWKPGTEQGRRVSQTAVDSWLWTGVEAQTRKSPTCSVLDPPLKGFWKPLSSTPPFANLLTNETTRNHKFRWTQWMQPACRWKAFWCGSCNGSIWVTTIQDIFSKLMTTIRNNCVYNLKSPCLQTVDPFRVEFRRNRSENLHRSVLICFPFQRGLKSRINLQFVAILVHCEKCIIIRIWGKHIGISAESSDDVGEWTSCSNDTNQRIIGVEWLDTIWSIVHDEIWTLGGFCCVSLISWSVFFLCFGQGGEEGGKTSFSYVFWVGRG